MKQITIKCPECGKEFALDSTDASLILQQVHTEEFEAQVKKQVEEQLSIYKKHLEEKRALETEKIVNDELKKTEASFKEELAKVNALLEETKQDRTRLKLALDQQIAQTEFYRDLKTQMSTKMVGETLEQHCENTFNMSRSFAFPNAEFDKDNDARTGSKGDYIFREKDPESGEEIISIMFEMKNECDDTKEQNRHKNEDFFKELDKDRREKNCEYAILVSMLEKDSELYNGGIVDVSHKYPKMFVIRPQFFLSIIGLLRNASLDSLQYKKEMSVMKAQQYELAGFEDKLCAFKSDFGSKVNTAGKNFQSAIKTIEESIKKLESTRDFLLDSIKHLNQANDKVDGITIRKLTHGLPSVKEKLDEERKKNVQVEETEETSGKEIKGEQYEQ